MLAERLNLTWEKGDGAVPFRAEAGDYFASFSPRTIQLNLKGAQIDIQPGIGGSKTRSSAVVFSGVNQSIYRDIDYNRDMYHGASALIDDPRYGIYALNVVNNHREADVAAGLEARNQTVFGIATEHKVELAGQRLTLEAEIAHFIGDHAAGDGGGTDTGEADNGYYFQLDGRGDSPLTYNLRYENYGADYRPNGASITPDRQTIETGLGWRFTDGLQLRLRGQAFRDSLESDNPTDTSVGGVNLSGPVLPSRSRWSADRA